MEHGGQPEHGIKRDTLEYHLRAQLLEGVLAAYEREYRTQNAEFADIDGKAQATITVGGIFLAAALAFLKQDQLELAIATAGHFIVYIIGGVVLLLVASILSCTIAMKERWILGPLRAQGHQAIVDDLLKLNPQELTSERMANFVRDQVGVWREATTTMEKALDGKAKWVMWGQLLLTSAIILTAFLLLLTLISA
jgi:hypothetical protein